MEDQNFISIAALLCEPSRAKIVWNLLDGRAYTATELAVVTDLSSTSVSNHLSKLLKGKLLKVSIQGRHRYYSFANVEVAYAVESLANLGEKKSSDSSKKHRVTSGVKYCRTCYDHLAGYVGVSITEALLKQEYLIHYKNNYQVSEAGWEWLNQMHIYKSLFQKTKRPLTRQCLDWSERKSHLAGHLGAVLLNKMLENNWFKKVEFSRALVITSKGSQSIHEQLGIVLH